MPQWTGVVGSRPVAAATSAVIGPSRSEASLSGGISAAQPSRSASDEARPARGFQRSVWQPSEVASLAATPESRKAQYCGQARIAAVRAASGKRRNCHQSCAPRTSPAGSRGVPVSAKSGRARS